MNLESVEISVEDLPIHSEFDRITLYTVNHLIKSARIKLAITHKSVMLYELV